MKNFLFITIALLGFIQINAQNTVLQSFYNNHKDIEDVASFNMGGNFLKNMTMGDDKEGKIQSTLDQLTILNIPFAKVSSSALSNLKKAIKKDRYEELITYRNGKENIHVYIKEKKDYIEELLVMVENTSEDLLLVNLSGMILFEDLKHIDIDGRAGEVIRELEH